VAGEYRCLFCRLESDGIGVSCPHCGALVDVRQRTASSGWTKQPPIKDMTRLRFGHSSCQISGTLVPVAEMRLDPSDTVSFAHHCLLHADPSVSLDLRRMPDGWQRSLAGLPVYVMDARGPGFLAISADAPGSMIAVPLMPGQTIEVTEHRFLAATGNVDYEWVRSLIWYTTRHEHENFTHYPLGGAYLDRFTAKQAPGLVFLHAPGDTFVRDLSEDDTILIKPEALVWKDQSVRISLHTEKSNGGDGFYMWIKLSGPGRIVIKSIFGYAGWNGTIVDSSPRTRQTW
jgi:uncharacterized protein (AIM24 family)